MHTSLNSNPIKNAIYRYELQSGQSIDGEEFLRKRKEKRAEKIKLRSKEEMWGLNNFSDMSQSNNISFAPSINFAGVKIDNTNSINQGDIDNSLGDFSKNPLRLLLHAEQKMIPKIAFIYKKDSDAAISIVNSDSGDFQNNLEKSSLSTEFFAQEDSISAVAANTNDKIPVDNSNLRRSRHSKTKMHMNMLME